MPYLETPMKTRAASARTRTALGVLAWTAPLALLLFLPETALKRAQASEVEASPEPAMGMIARPLAFLSHQRVLSYPFEQVWPTAIRYLAVERKYVLTARDPDAGYMMFEFTTTGGNKGTGSLEMFRTTDAAGRLGVNLMVSTGNGPTHLPHTLAQGIAKKVRAERGSPAKPPAAPGEKNKDPPKDGQKDRPKVDHNGVPLMPPPINPGEL